MLTDTPSAALDPTHRQCVMLLLHHVSKCREQDLNLCITRSSVVRLSQLGYRGLRG